MTIHLIKYIKVFNCLLNITFSCVIGVSFGVQRKIEDCVVNIHQSNYRQERRNMDTTNTMFIILTFAIIMGDMIEVTNGGMYNSYLNLRIFRNSHF